MAEWLNAAALKAVDRFRRSGGSNPSPSAHSAGLPHPPSSSSASPWAQTGPISSPCLADYSRSPAGFEGLVHFGEGRTPRGSGSIPARSLICANGADADDCRGAQRGKAMLRVIPPCPSPTQYLAKAPWEYRFGVEGEEVPE